MGTTAQKLTYLNETKSQLKDMINYGLDSESKITNETTFREYVNSTFKAFIESLRNPDTLFNNLPKVTGTGTNVTLNNTVNVSMKIELDASELEQDGTPIPSTPQEIHTISGDNTIKTQNKNQCNITSASPYYYSSGLPNGSSTQIITDSFNANNITFHSTFANYNMIMTNVIQLKPNTEYTLSFNRTTTATNNQTFVYNYDNGTYAINYRDNNTNLYEITFTTSANGQIVLAFGHGGVIGTTTISNIQLEIGSSKTSFAPHEEQEYELNLPVENLLKTTFTSATTVNGITFTPVIDNGLLQYININGTATANASVFLGSSIQLKAGTYTFTTGIGINSNIYSMLLNNSSYAGVFRSDITGYTTKTITEQTVLPYVYVNSGTTVDNVKLYIQLEKGSKANTYQPYGTTPLEVCKIGDYADEFVKQSDNKWYLKKNIGKVVLDGSETNWIKSSNSSVDRFVNQTTRPGMTVFTALSNYFANQSSTNPGTFYFDSYTVGRIVINFSTPNTTTLEQFLTWLSTHNTEIYYVLATPTYILLNDTLQTQLNNIRDKALAYQDQTNISQVNNDLPFVINASAIQNLNN